MKLPIFLSLLAVAVAEAKGGSLNRKYQGHGSAWKEFETLSLAAKDLGAGETKVNGLPPVVLDALAERLGIHVPSTRIYRAGCVASAEQLVGPSSRGTYDLLLPPETDGTCISPALSPGSDTEDFTTKMQWRAESAQHEERQSTLPPVEAVFDAVFARRAGQTRRSRPSDPSLSFWLLSFVNWFHDDNFRTVPDTDGGFTWSDRGSLHMVQLYGHTEYRQRALRTLQGDGKLKTSSQLGWDYYPPLLTDIQVDYPEFDMWTSNRGSVHASTSAGQSPEEADDNLPYYFAIGDPRFNLHPGHILWTSVGLYLHNTACDILVKEDPLLTDEDIFQRARVMVFHIVQKIRLQDFVTDSVASTRDHIRIPYNPEVLREHFAPHFPYNGGHKPNFMEFNHVYQAWHSLIPDNLHNLKGAKVPLHKTMWSPKLFFNYTIGEWASSFASTPLTQYGPHNFPLFLRGITQAAIHDERAQRMASYNAYRRYVGMEPLLSFDQLAVDNPQELAALYHHDIDSLEFLVGVVGDSHPDLPGNIFGDVQLLVVALFALHDVSSNALVLNPVLWSSDYLTEGGLKFVQDFEFRDLLGQLTGQSHPCPFRTHDSRCIEPEQWKAPEEVGSCFLKSQRVCSFVGVDLTEWYFYENGYLRLNYLLTLFSMAGVLLLYLAVFALLAYLWPIQSLDDKKDKDNNNNNSDLAIERTEIFTLHEPSSEFLSTQGRVAHSTTTPGAEEDRTMLFTLQEGSSEHSVTDDPTDDVSGPRQRRKSKGGPFTEGRDDIYATKLALEKRNNQLFVQRIRLCTLTINVLLSLGLVVPTTMVWYSFVSDPYWIQTFADFNYLYPGLPYSIVACHFVIEVVFRLAQFRVAQSSSMIVQLAAHHLGYFAIGALSVASADVAILKLGFTVMVGWTWEWPLFVSFWVVRILDTIRGQDSSNNQRSLTHHGNKSTCTALYKAIVLYFLPLMIFIYFASRIVEAAFISMIVACTVQRSAVTGPVIAMIVIMSICIALQLYAGYILLQFSLRRRRGLAKERATPADRAATKTVDQRQISLADDSNAPSEEPRLDHQLVIKDIWT